MLQRGCPRSEHRSQVQLEQCQGQSLSLEEGLETSGREGRWQGAAGWRPVKKMVQLLPVCQGPANCSLPVGQICLLPTFAQSLKLRMVLTFFKELLLFFFKDPEGIEYAVEVAYDPTKSKTFPFGLLQEKLVVGR